MWNWSQLPDFHHCWAKNCMGIPLGMPKIQWFCLKQPILSILNIFQLLKNLKKQILLQTTVNMCETGHNNLTFTTVELKNCMGIPWCIPEIQWFCLKQLKTAYSKHFEDFPATEKFKKQILLQTTAHMCETGHNNLTFTAVEQKIAWEYLEAWLRYSDFA